MFSRSLSSILCSKRQLRSQNCSCLSTILSSFYIFSFILTMSLFKGYIISSSSCRSRSYSSSLLVIKSIASFKEINWLLPIISLSFFFFFFFHISGELLSSFLPTFSCNYKELLHSHWTTKIQ